MPKYTMVFQMGLYFALRSGQEHRHLHNGFLELCNKNPHGVLYFEIKEPNSFVKWLKQRTEHENFTEYNGRFDE